MSINLKRILADFRRAAQSAGAPIVEEDLTAEILPAAPHAPPTSLPRGKMAVYMYFRGDQCLKVGVC